MTCFNPPLHHHHPFHGSLCKCLSSFFRITTRFSNHGAVLSRFNDAHLLLVGRRFHVGKVLDEMHHRKPAQVEGARDGRVGGGESTNNDSYTSTGPEKMAWRRRADRGVGGNAPPGDGSDARAGKRSFGLRRSGDTRNSELGTSGFRSTEPLGDRGVGNGKAFESSRISKGKIKSKDMVGMENKGRTRGKVGKEERILTPEIELKIGLNTCSKKGDVMGAIDLYDSALRDGIRLKQHHYNVLLYLCSSAALGVVQAGKSGTNSSGGALTSVDLSGEIIKSLQTREESEVPDEVNFMLESEAGHALEEDRVIRVSKEIQTYASGRGFEIYERMCAEKIALNEAALTSVARMAMSRNDGDLAFEIVKKIRDLGLTLRSRSYGPALFSFCKNDDINKAFEVEKHMVESGIEPEEHEITALLKMSVRANDSGKVYYLLHKLRTNVRKVSPSTAELIVSWFHSPTASRVGKRNWNDHEIAQAVENGGGGWHGLGWLGKGKWDVVNAEVDVAGICQSCGEKLVAIDIDPIETENFGKSVASIAAQRENNSSFQNFQKWLEYYGPFEVVVDAANVGTNSQSHFSLKKVNSVVNGMCQKLSSRKWPLVIMHNKRLSGLKMDEPANRKIVEKWKKANAIYTTPTGSNDDWYWLYAAVTCKSLLVTNDEMRDHLFQILGNDFFPKWKERHQVRINTQFGSPEYIMPPACSIVIQESRKGSWHIPISHEQESETARIWLCVTRFDAKVADKQS